MRLRKLYIFLTIFFGFILINSLIYTAIKTKQLKLDLSEIHEYFGNLTDMENSMDSIMANSTMDTVSMESMEKVKIDTAFLHVDSTRNAQNVCAVPIYDFWHESRKHLMVGYDPTSGCDKNFKKWTELENSTWRIVKEGANCKARCFEGINGGSREADVLFHDWMTEPGHVDCEFLEAVCSENGQEVYGHIHTQIIPKSRDPPKTVFPDPPSVIVITFDSMDVGMAKRSIPNFLAHFQTELGAVEFPFVNKLGENSKPNGYPLWFGKSLEPGRRVTWEEIIPDWNFTQYCETYLDNSSIFRNFKEHGYTTLNLEEYPNTLVDSWPDCIGFKKPSADHLFSPFAWVGSQIGTQATRSHLTGRHCSELYHRMMEFLEQAMQTYTDRPLFSWSWFNIAHNNIDALMRADGYMVEYFKRNHKFFDNSFVFIASDHGFRTGHMDTEIGNFEKDNPYLGISIPRKYRDEKFGILEIMRKNSKQLQTHFDTRATLLDILKYQPKSQYMDRKTFKIPSEKGDSLIRHQPDIPRTCSTLPILKQYCICQVEKFQIQSEALKTRLGQKLLDHVHQLLAESNSTEICEKYQLKEVTNLIEYGYTTQWNTYKIAIKTQNPSTAHFETMMTYDNVTDTANFERPIRLDTYGSTTDCTNTIRKESLCYCK